MSARAYTWGQYQQLRQFLIQNMGPTTLVDHGPSIRSVNKNDGHNT